MNEIVRELLELQAREGWLSPTSLEALSDRLRVPLHRLESVSTFYTHFEREKPAGRVIEVCRDLSCRMAGASQACAALRRSTSARGDSVVREVSCLGRCDRAPAAAIGEASVRADDLATVEAILDGGSDAERAHATRLPRAWPTVDPYCSEASTGPASSPSSPSSTSPSSSGRPRFDVLRTALSKTPAELIAEIEAAGLRGMGGAGFPTGRKWSLVAAARQGESVPRHVLCNADESEPGTFKDREILHDLPHLVIEGILLAAYCVGAASGTVFIRHEYAPERHRLEGALEAARAAGAIGERIFGSDFSFELDIFVSPGGYILGEETALLECMEGRRGEPRNKPPFPGISGLNGNPTLINNVETLVHAVGIVDRGAERWRSLGRDGYAGHKFVSTSGDVVRPGVELFPFGTPIAEILEAHGGMRGGGLPLAIAPGGASSSFLGPEALEIPLDFDRLQEAGSMLGSGAVVFVEEGRDLLDIGLSITRFFRNESCGKCVPCRIGSEKAVEMIESTGRLGAETEEKLRALHETMKETSICGLGQVALAPLLSLATRFPEQVGSSSSKAGS